MTYRHVVITQHGAPSVLQTVEDALPDPKAGEVRVKILATAVAYTDILIRKGLYPGIPKPPVTPGYDLVGEVDALGPGVTDLAIGQRVAALTVIGSYGEFLCLPTTELVPVPDAVDPAEAATLVLHDVTAYQMLHRVAQVKSGDRILVHGIAGGVGIALLQLARLQGVEVYGTASAGKHPLIRQLGGIPIDYRQEDFVPRIRELAPVGVDAVFDLVGGNHLFRSYQVLRPRGILVSFGFLAAAKATHHRKLKLLYHFLCLGLLSALRWKGRKVTFYSITALKQQHPEWFRQDLTTLLDHLAQGQLCPIIAQRLPLSAAQQAQTLLEQAAVSGSLVLLCH